MNSVAQAAPYVFPLMGAAAVAAFIIQVIVKPVINHYLTRGTSNQNAAVRASVYVVTLAVVSVSQFLHYQLNTRADVSTALGVSFVVAGLAITAFHVLTSDALPTLPIPAFQGEAIAPPSGVPVASAPAAEPIVTP